jgi:hypothetical protein
MRGSGDLYVPSTISHHSTCCPHSWTTIIDGDLFEDGFSRKKCAFCGEIVEVLFVGSMRVAKYASAMAGGG